MKEYKKFELWLARQLGKGCRKLHLTAPTIASYQIDIDGIGFMKSKSNSWVRNMINVMAGQGLLGAPLNGNVSFFEDGFLNLRNLAGTIETLYAGSFAVTNTNTGYYAGEGAWNWGVGSSYGVQVGSSNEAESFNNYKLGSIIPHGNSGGQLYRNVQNLLSRTWDSTNRKWVQTLQRTFINNSGGSIVVKELGMYVHDIGGLWFNGSDVGINQYTATNGYMIIRDVLPASITVNNGQTLTVTYTIEYSF